MHRIQLAAGVPRRGRPQLEQVNGSSRVVVSSRDLGTAVATPRPVPFVMSSGTLARMRLAPIKRLPQHVPFESCRRTSRGLDDPRRASGEFARESERLDKMTVVACCW